VSFASLLHFSDKRLALVCDILGLAWLGLIERAFRLAAWFSLAMVRLMALLFSFGRRLDWRLGRVSR